MTIETSPIAISLQQHGYPPPRTRESANRFLPAKVVGRLAYVSSVTPLRSDGHEIVGRIGVELSVGEAAEAARWCVAHSLANLCQVVQPRAVLGVVDVLVVCNAVTGFSQHSEIADAASELLEQVFGSAGSHTRGAIGAASTVRNVPVVMKAIYEVTEGA